MRVDEAQPCGLEEPREIEQSRGIKQSRATKVYACNRSNAKNRNKCIPELVHLQPLGMKKTRRCKIVLWLWKQ